jgi:hypothetical protein
MVFISVYLFISSYLVQIDLIRTAAHNYYTHSKPQRTTYSTIQQVNKLETVQDTVHPSVMQTQC